MRKPAYLRLGVNIDHVATIRNARGGRASRSRCAPRISPSKPAPTASRRTCARTGATSPTRTSPALKRELTRPLNLEMAATDEMLAIALRHLPQRRAASCRSGARSARPRAASTSRAGATHLRRVVGDLQERRHPRLAVHRAGSARRSKRRAAHRRRQSSNCTPAPIASARSKAMPQASRASSSALTAAARLADAARARGACRPRPRHSIRWRPSPRMPQIVELNIGHFLIGEAIFVGLASAVQRMRALMDEARTDAVSRPARESA